MPDWAPAWLPLWEPQKHSGPTPRHLSLRSRAPRYERHRNRPGVGLSWYVNEDFPYVGDEPSVPQPPAVGVTAS